MNITTKSHLILISITLIALAGVLLTAQSVLADEDHAVKRDNTKVSDVEIGIQKPKINPIRLNTTDNNIDKKIEPQKSFLEDARDRLLKKRKASDQKTTDVRHKIRPADVKPATINVQERSTGEKRDDVHSISSDRQESLKQTAGERKELAKKRALSKIQAYTKRILKRFAATLNRLSTIADRVESRIEKLEDRGIDLSDAREQLQNAREEIGSAKTTVSKLEGLAAAIATSENPREAVTHMRELFVSAKTQVKAAHKALVEVIRIVKAAVGTTSGTLEVEADQQ
jgi:DNA repair exonuclease SbcCD ATPase subunit|tara:strand:- start:1505 stop:2359 length:855 start_codon:yes stop_codon:yes gene_type:complete